MAAPTLETNAAADTLRIMAGTSGNPVTWNDVWDWDDGGGSSGGAGDVPKDGGGTAKVNTFMTETVANSVYLILKNIDFGNGSTSTYFKTIEEMIYFSGNKYPTITANATLQMGEKSSDDYGIRGSYMYWKSIGGAGLGWDFATGILLMYASTICSNTDEPHYMPIIKNASSEIIDSVFEGLHAFEIAASITWTRSFIKRITYTVLIGSVNAITLSNLMGIDCAVGFELITSNNELTLIQPLIYGQGTAYKLRTHAPHFDSDVLIINRTQSDLFDDFLWQAHDADLYDKFYIDIHIADKDGANLESVTCLLEDTGSNTIFSVSTAASGSIAQQTVSYKRYYYDSSGQIQTYSPHKLTLSKAGYKTLVLDNITVDGAVDWHLELQPAYEMDMKGNLYKKINGNDNQIIKLAA